MYSPELDDSLMDSHTGIDSEIIIASYLYLLFIVIGMVILIKAWIHCDKDPHTKLASWWLNFPESLLDSWYSIFIDYSTKYA